MSGRTRPRAACRFAAGLAIAFGLLALAPAHRAQGSPADDFNRARNAFTFGNYQEAIRLFESLLAPPVKLRDEAQLVEARQLLGVCQYFVRNYFAAQEAFERLLYLRPRHELDPLLFPPPVIEFFEKVRARIKDKLARLHPEKTPKKQPDTLLVRRVEKRPWLLNLFPLGVGQWSNGRTGKAVFFLSSQLAMLTTNLVAYGVAESRRRPDGSFAAADEATARALRTTQIVSLAALGALVAWGLTDAFLDWRPEVVTEERQPLPAAPAAPPPPPRKGASLRLYPFATPTGGGLALGLRY